MIRNKQLPDTSKTSNCCGIFSNIDTKHNDPAKGKVKDEEDRHQAYLDALYYINYLNKIHTV